MSLTNTESNILRWRNSPVDFVRDVFDVEPDIWQVEALDAFASWDRDKIRITLQACAGPGKSAVLAWCGWNFLLCYAEKNEHPKGAAVSVTWDNLKDNLWVELRKWQVISPMLTSLFTWTQRKIYCNDHPETWFLSARSFPRTADIETLGKTLSGVHSKYVLFLVDESGDIPIQVGKAADQAVGETVARGGFIKIMQAGNPISREGMLYSASKSDLWFKIRITGDPDDPKRSNRIDAEETRKLINEHGRDDPWVMSYILGRFPNVAINTLLTVDEVEDAMSRHLDSTAYSHSQKRLGIDCAGRGMDSNVIFPRQGKASYMYVELRNPETNDFASRVIHAKANFGSELEFVDGTGGWGSDLMYALREVGQTPIDVQFAGKADDIKYYNKRSEMWFRMAKWVKAGGALPKCERLKKELVTPTHTLKNGRFILEPKDQIKKRIGRSPDLADALCLTFAYPEMPSQANSLGNIKGSIKSGAKGDYNVSSGGMKSGTKGYKR